MSLETTIIARGYLPLELPPPFTSGPLAKFVAGKGLGVLNALWTKQPWTRGMRHSLARPGGLRRSLTIPNPVNFLRVTEAVATAWPSHIRPLLKKARLATSRPVRSAGPRSFAPVASNRRAEIEALSRSGCKYLLVADVQNFFASIYTHSIPWMLHGKAAAKAAMKSPTLLGNAIDKAIRDGQDGQTMGLPVGPDTSWVLAEALLARVEEALAKRIPRLRGHRFSDDMSIATRTQSEAEDAMDALQSILADYELSLNPRKTSILQLPLPIEDRGISELRGWKFRSTDRPQRADLIAYFDRAAALMGQDEGEKIASYALARLRSQPILSTSWPLVEALILQFLVAEPSCARQAAMSLSMLAHAGLSLEKAAVTDAAEALVLRHAALGHASEVSWAIWLCLAAKSKLSKKTATAVSKMDDSVVALLALHARHEGLAPASMSTSRWEACMTDAELLGPHWLLSYEARQKGWLPSLGVADHRNAHPAFKAFAAAGVSFYDSTALSLTFKAHSPQSYGGAGGGPYAHLFA